MQKAPSMQQFLRQYQALSEQLDDRTVCLVATHYAINGTKDFCNTGEV